MNESVSVGEMDYKISLFKFVRVQTETGASAKQKILVANVWAAKNYLSTTKELEDRVIASNVVEFVVYWQPKIANENIQDLTIEDGAQVYEIFGFSLIGRRDFIKLKCQLRE